MWSEFEAIFRLYTHAVELNETFRCYVIRVFLVT
jgi:hypothetical protein